MITLITEQKIEELEWFIKEFKEQKEEIQALKNTLNNIKDALLESVKVPKPSKIETCYVIDGYLQVASEDCEGQWSWFGATDLCRNLGGGLRLPTKEELNLMYLHKDKIGGFSKYAYWSSTSSSDKYAWMQYNGKQNFTNKGYQSLYVRAVRSI